MQRPLASQPSAVQTVPSPAHGVALAAGVPPHRPAWQLSTAVQSLPSSQAVPSTTGAPVHVPPWQLSGPVQPLPSLHGLLSSTGVPRQTPPWQLSGPVQSLPSLHGVLSATVAPVQTPPWQLSVVVQSLPSSHDVLSGAALPLQVPPAQVSLSVQLFPSSHAAPFSRVGSPAQVPSWHASLAVQKFPSSHTVPFAWKVSGGHVALAPVHVSAASHAPAEARQTAPAFPAGCWHVSFVPSQVSAVHWLPSSVHAVPLGCFASAGQFGPLPGQSSATSHPPPHARHGPAHRPGRLDRAASRAAVGVQVVPVITLLTGIERPVSARRPVGGDRRRPQADAPERAARSVGPRRGHDLVLGIDGDVVGRSSEGRTRRGGGQGSVPGPGGKRFGLLRLDADSPE